MCFGLVGLVCFRSFFCFDSLLSLTRETENDVVGKY